MTPENANETKSFEFKKSYKPNESILINNQYGITLTCKHEQIHISILNDKTMAQMTNDLESGVFNKLTLENILITACQNAKNETEIKIESENQIQIIEYNFPQDFLKLFEYRKQKRENESTLSLEGNHSLQ